jgi:hypothetical protein
LSAALADADLENAGPGDFGGLDASDAGLQTALTVLAVLTDGISYVAEAAGDADRLEVPTAPLDALATLPPRLFLPYARGDVLCLHR